MQKAGSERCIASPYQVDSFASPDAVGTTSPKTRIVPPRMSRAAIPRGSPDQREWDDD